MADKAIYSVDTVTSMSDADKVYINTGNNIKQISKNNLCGNDIKGVNDSLNLVYTFGVGTTTRGKIDTDGSIVVDSYHSVTDFIPITAHQQFTSNNIAKSWDSKCYTVYNSNKEVISTHSFSESISLVPQENGYIRASVNNSMLSTASFTSKGIYTALETNNADINTSLSDYGLNNVFDGELQQGTYNSSGAWVSSDYHVTNKNAIVLSNAKTVSVKSNNSTIYVFTFFNGTTFVSRTEQVSSMCVVPPNATKCYLSVGNSNKISVATAGHIGIYIDEATDVLKNDLSDYGLNNTFDGHLRNGYFNDNGATYTSTADEVCGYSLTPCSAGDVVTIKNNIAGKRIYLKFFDSNNTILAKQSTTDNEITMIAPANSAKFAWSIAKTNITPNQAGHVGVYINNQIDEVKNDLGELTKTVTVTLSSTNATESFDVKSALGSDYAKYTVLSFELNGVDYAFESNFRYVRYTKSSGTLAIQRASASSYGGASCKVTFIKTN